MSATFRPRQAYSVAARLTFFYLVVGSLWIYFSDQFLLSLTNDANVLSEMQSWKGWLFVIGSALLLYVVSRALTTDIERAHQRTSAAYQATLDSLMHAIELRDMDTEGHSQRVVRVALKLADALDYPEEKLGVLSQGALLHDIGKIGVSDQILRKPGKLTTQERAVMQTHAQRGYELLNSVSHLTEAAVIPLCHHERWDGDGYPSGLKGKAIPLEARIFALVDVWDALISDRPYRKAWRREQAFDYIVENSGKEFDPAVVEAFVRLKNQEQIMFVKARANKKYNSKENLERERKEKMRTKNLPQPI